MLCYHLGLLYEAKILKLDTGKGTEPKQVSGLEGMLPFLSSSGGIGVYYLGNKYIRKHDVSYLVKILIKFKKL